MKCLRFMGILLSAMILAGCGSTTKSVMLSDGSKGLLARCDGEDSSWGDCYALAADACQSGFNLVEKEQYDNDGEVKRNLYFNCK